MERLLDRIFTGQTLFAAIMALLLVSVVGYANSLAESKVTQVATHNVAATSLLARIQIQAEKLRRYEKEMFIYASQPEKRTKYIKEHADASAKLLDLQNEGVGTNTKGFTEADRAEIMKWKQATLFYTSEFNKVIFKAENAAADPNLTVTLNNDIGPGKDRFREVLDGSSKMRGAKEQLSQSIATEIRRGFNVVFWAVIAMALLMVLAAMFVFTPKASASRVDPRASKLQRAEPSAQ